MKRLAALFFLVGACGAPASHQSSTLQDERFDSAHTIALDAALAGGSAIVSTSDESGARAEIERQLMYSIGQLNGENGGPDMQRAEIQVGALTPRQDGRFDAAYDAKLFVAWPRERQIPQSYRLILPEGGDARSRQAFVTTYGPNGTYGGACSDWTTASVGIGNYWYYYRPNLPNCPLRSAQAALYATTAEIRFSISPENTEGKYPEYHKVWEDGRLVVTAIFGKNESHVTADNDAGIAAYIQMHDNLIQTFGRPQWSSLGGARPGNAQPEARLIFQTARGQVDVHLFLVPSLPMMSADFRRKYEERVRVSDFVSYSGHSGYGANIRALASMGQFTPGQYRIFLVNGCDTFAYVDGSLRDAHLAANPGASPHKYFDIVTNAMPSYFHSNARSNLAFITALVEQRRTYRQILAQFDPAQRANVMGEEDNRWPEPF